MYPTQPMHSVPPTYPAQFSSVQSTNAVQPIYPTQFSPAPQQKFPEQSKFSSGPVFAVQQPQAQQMNAVHPFYHPNQVSPPVQQKFAEQSKFSPGPVFGVQQPQALQMNAVHPFYHPNQISPPVQQKFANQSIFSPQNPFAAQQLNAQQSHVQQLNPQQMQAAQSIFLSRTASSSQQMNVPQINATQTIYPPHSEFLPRQLNGSQSVYPSQPGFSPRQMNGSQPVFPPHSEFSPPQVKKAQSIDSIQKLTRSNSSGTDISYILGLIQEQMHSNLSKLEDELRDELKLTKAKVHLVITKGNDIYKLDRVLRMQKKNADLFFSIIVELDDRVKSIGKIFGKNVKFELDIFFKSINKKYVWYHEEHLNKMDIEGKNERCQSMYKEVFQDYYDKMQSIKNRERITIFDKDGKLDNPQNFDLNNANLDQIQRKPSSEKKLKVVDKVI